MNSPQRTRGLTGLVVAALVVAGILAVFAVEISAAQRKSRDNLESQARQRAVLVSGLIDTVFQLQTHIGHDALAALSARRVPRHDLDDFTGDKRYVALLDPRGAIVSHSDGFDAADLADVRRSHAASLISGGRMWGVSDVMPGDVVDIVSRVDSPDGDRALVTGVPLSSLSGFVTAELHRVPGVTAQHQLLLDGAGVVVGSTNPLRPSGYVFHTRAQLQALHHPSGIVHSSLGVRYFDQVPLAGTRWKLIVSVPVAEFFASVSGFRHALPWIVFAAFGVMALIALALTARSLKSAERIRVANVRLTESNAELGAAQVRQEETNLALAQSNEALGRSYEELERQARELVRSNSELDQFASIASHDLQEPLRKVRTFTERVSDTEAGNLSERGSDYLRRANASAERMQTLIEDLLRYSRVTTQARPFAPVDLSSITADVIDDLSEQVNRTGARIEVGALPTINADAPQMRQLVQNLVSNALKFRREDAAPVVRVDAEMSSGWLTLTVADNGIGFDPQYAQRIFRVFERLHGRGTYPGTGIGLALCRKIAERHGGSVVAESAPGEGATFTVTMQTERTEAVAAVPEPDASNGSQSRKEPYVAA